jgi:glycerol uptake facilitator-like aquaporin
VKFLRPVWVAFRAAVIATAVFWLTIFIIENSGWEVSADIAQPLVFFVLFFFGMLLVPRR